MSTSTKRQLHEQFILSQLIRFGRRPCVRIVLSEPNPSAALTAYAQRIGAVYIQDGLNVTHAQDTEVDYTVYVSHVDMAHERVRMFQHSLFQVSYALRYMWVHWPVNPMKNFKRVQYLTPDQLDAFILHYTGQKHLLHRLYTAQRYNKTLYDVAVDTHRRLMAIEGVCEAFELSPGQDVTHGTRPVTINVHVKYRLVNTLYDAIQRATSVLLLPDVTRDVLVRMERPADPVDWDNRVPVVKERAPVVLQHSTCAEWPSLAPSSSSEVQVSGMSHLIANLAQLAKQARVTVGAGYRLF